MAEASPHNATLHTQAVSSGAFTDEALFDVASMCVSLIHFADESHGVRLELHDRGVTFVIDTPAWLDLETVVATVSAEEPVLGVGYAIVERESVADEAVYRVTVQGGDVVGQASVVFLDSELKTLRAALESTRAAVEAADAADHERVGAALGFPAVELQTTPNPEETID
ncbi:MAG: hypothetical protein U0821_05010 [Chloroflexota bacterium]